LLLVTVVFCCALLLATMISATKNGAVSFRIAFACAALLSAPILWMLERGNIILLTLVALMIYAFAYNSENKVKREIALIALAFAFSIKLYPVVFAWFLIIDKRYKDFARCLLYGACMLIIPSFFFGGPIFCFRECLSNIFGFSSGVGNTITVVMTHLEFSPVLIKLINVLAYAWVLVCGISFAVSSVVNRENTWKTWAIGFVTILCVPSLTAIYNWAFLLIPMIMLFNKEKRSVRDLISAGIIMIPFMHIPFRIHKQASLLEVVLFVMTAVLSVFLVVNTVFDTVKFIKQRKESQ
jgi:hypothetical protein